MNADDYFAIQNLINRYFQKVDTGEFKSCGSLFANADVHYPKTGVTISRDPAAVAELMSSYVKLYGKPQSPLTRHHSGNMIIEALSPHEARAECSAIIFQGTPEFAFQAIAEASYNDTFAKSGDTWTFTRREISLTFMGEMKHHLSREVKS